MDDHEKAVCPQDQRAIAFPFAIDLGEHLLEVREEQVLLIVDHGPGAVGVRLDGEETYNLLVTLQALFQASVTSD